MSEGIEAEVLALARDVVAIDSRFFVSSVPVAERFEQALDGFEVERVDYSDQKGVAKRALVALRPQRGGGAPRPALALCGHMDTVPATGWTDDPFDPRLAEGMLHGLGSCDMKGPTAAAVIAARHVPPEVPVMLMLTADEDGGGKLGARAIRERSELVRRHPPKAIQIVEPTGLQPVRGHRASYDMTAVAIGRQAHSSTGRGVNANLKAIPYLVELGRIHDWLRADKAMQDAAYDPPFSDFNIVIDNHGAGRNICVGRTTVLTKYRFSRSIDPEPVVARVRAAAAAAGLEFSAVADGVPFEIPADSALVTLAERLSGRAVTTAPYGTDATVLAAIAPTVIMGPGDVGYAHQPNEQVQVADLVALVPLAIGMAKAVDAMPGPLA